MATPNRAALLAKIHKSLKKHYKPVEAPPRPLLEQLLYAHCLENSPYPTADRVTAELLKCYFDLNELRVTSVTELSEVMAPVHDPRGQATNLKRTLQSVFETTYSFDLEAHKKKNLGQAIKDIEKLPGVTPFAMAYVTQHALAGHSIPIDKGAMSALVILGVLSEKEADAGTVPGLERAIPKNKGIEFGSLLHQLGVDLLSKPFSNEVREIFLSIAPDAKERLPKRVVKKELPPPKIETKPAAADKSDATVKVETGSKASAGKKAVEPPKAAPKKADVPPAAPPKGKAAEQSAKAPTPAKKEPPKPANKPKPVAKKDASAAKGKNLSKSKPR